MRLHRNLLYFLGASHVWHPFVRFMYLVTEGLTVTLWQQNSVVQQVTQAMILTNYASETSA
jgi:hypothetical protein